MESNIGRKDLDLQDNEDLKKRLLGATTEIGTGIGTDLLTGGLLNPATVAGTKGLSILAYAGINGFQGAYTNYLVQKHLYGANNVNWGEILSSGALSAVPFMNLKAGKNVANIVGDANTLRRGIVGGAGFGLAGEQLRVGIDEQRVLSPLEASMAVGLGGGLGGGLTQLSKLGKKPNVVPKFDPTGALDDYNMQRAGLKMRLLNSIDPEGRMHPLEKELISTNPKDYVSSEQIASWRTPGQKSQPLNFLFGERAGWRGGRLNLKSWREHPLKGDKNIAEQFLTAPGKGVVFSSEANKQNAFMSRVFGIEGARKLLGAPEEAGNIFQAHHKTATKAVLTGQEGLVYDSPYYHEIQKVWEDLELTLGNNPDNIIGTLGLVQRDLDSPHSLIHKFLDSKMGPDGTKFWTDKIMNQIVIYDAAGNAIGHKNFKLRKELTKKQARIFKEAVDLLKLAHRQYYLAKGVKPGQYLTTEAILDEEIVDSFINKLPPVGGTGKYTTSVIKKIAKEIADEPNPKPTIKSGSLKQLIADLSAERRFEEKIRQMYKFAITESNGEEMLIDVLFNGLTPAKALKKWRKNDPQFRQLSIRFNKALKQAKNPEVLQRIKELDTSLSDIEIRKIDPSGPLERTPAPENIQKDIDKG